MQSCFCAVDSSAIVKDYNTEKDRRRRGHGKKTKKFKSKLNPRPGSGF